MVPVIEIKMEFVEYGNKTTNDSRMQAVTKNNMEDLYALTIITRNVRLNWMQIVIRFHSQTSRHSKMVE